MAHLIGLFERGGSYYLRVVLPQHHHLRSHYRSGKVVLSLGKCSYRDAIRIGTQKRAVVLWGGKSPSLAPTGQVEPQPSQHQTPALTEVKPPLSLRKVWHWAALQQIDGDLSCGQVGLILVVDFKNEMRTIDMVLYANLQTVKDNMIVAVAVLAFFLGGYVAKGIATMDETKVHQIEANSKIKIN